MDSTLDFRHAKDRCLDKAQKKLLRTVQARKGNELEISLINLLYALFVILNLLKLNQPLI